jgi:hypothetical protein
LGKVQIPEGTSQQEISTLTPGFHTPITMHQDRQLFASHSSETAGIRPCAIFNQDQDLVTELPAVQKAVEHDMLDPQHPGMPMTLPPPVHQLQGVSNTPPPPPLVSSAAVNPLLLDLPSRKPPAVGNLNRRLGGSSDTEHPITAPAASMASHSSVEPTSAPEVLHASNHPILTEPQELPRHLEAACREVSAGEVWEECNLF